LARSAIRPPIVPGVSATGSPWKVKTSPTTNLRPAPGAAKAKWLNNPAEFLRVVGLLRAIKAKRAARGDDTGDIAAATVIASDRSKAHSSKRCSPAACRARARLLHRRRFRNAAKPQAASHSR
jgi:hypothetical protein